MMSEAQGFAYWFSHVAMGAAALVSIFWMLSNWRIK